ncbi:MAG: hypothetical protein WC781_03305 [Candidatus Pacearchaeota archaeon]|jgi:hypothetical protein
MTNKLFEDKNKLIEIELENLKVKLNENLDKLPNEELPFMESHLRALYFQAYFLTAYGFYNASLVLCGILLEVITKEKLFIEGVKDEEIEKMNFGNAISKCKSLNCLIPEELNFLESKRDELRNPYAHYNKIKLTKDKYVPTWEVPNAVEKLIELAGLVTSGKITEEQARKELIKGQPLMFKSSKEFRPIAQAVKSEEDKIKAIPIFLEIDKFVREFAIKYFKGDESP